MILGFCWGRHIKKARTKLFNLLLRSSTTCGTNIKVKPTPICVSINFTSFATFEIVEVPTARNKANAFPNMFYNVRTILR